MKNSIFLSFLLCTGCSSYEPLVFNKEIYSNSNLKTDGYFYFFSNEDMGKNYTTKIYDSFILYQNGVFYNVSHSGYEKVTNIESRLKLIDDAVLNKVTREKEYINTRPNWGVFKINNSKIEIENWTFASGGGDYPTMRKIGEIINDTTIHFHTLIGVHPLNVGQKKKEVSIDETYHFRKFSPKPDSTNKWIK